MQLSPNISFKSGITYVDHRSYKLKVQLYHVQQRYLFVGPTFANCIFNPEKDAPGADCKEIMQLNIQTLLGFVVLLKRQRNGYLLLERR